MPPDAPKMVSSFDGFRFSNDVRQHDRRVLPLPAIGGRIERPE
jgi:hypothetical protein